jgi:hypothetical protein
MSTPPVIRRVNGDGLVPVVIDIVLSDSTDKSLAPEAVSTALALLK